jgi:hypothetical protein
MGPDNLRDRLVFGSGPHVGENSTDFRERMAHIQAESARRREEELHEQISPSNTPAMRVQIWERLHQVALPRNPAHALMAIIATQTGLTLDEVLLEQRLRFQPAVAPVATAESQLS